MNRLRQSLGRTWRNLPFRQKLAGLLIALVTMPIIVVVLYTTYSTRETLLASTRVRNLERANGTAQIIDAFFLDARADVRVASGLSTVVDLCEDGSGEGRFDRALRSLKALRDEQRLLAIYVTDRAGRVVVTTDERVTLGGYETGRAFLTAVAGETVIDEPEYDPFDKRVALRVSNAVRSEDGTIVGTVTTLIHIEALDELTRHDDNYGGYGEFSVLWSGAGVLLSHSSDTSVRFASWMPLPPDMAVATRQRLGPAFPIEAPTDAGYAPVAERGAWLLYDRTTNPHLRIISEQHGPLEVTAVPLQGQRWVYGIFVPESSLLGALRTQMQRDWAVAFFTVLSTLALSMIAAGLVTKPLRRITSTANALATGDMTRRAHLDQEDEFGQLGDAFDAMADALAEKEVQLQAHAAELERRVQERTARLELFERASRTLASSLELRRTAENLAGLLVPDAADFASIEVRDLNGNLRRVACRHRDADLERAANELAEVRPTRDVVGKFTAAERTMLRLTDTRAYELTAGRQFVGVLFVAMTEGGRAFDEAAEAVFEEIGRRAGLALANALLYQEAQDANRLKDEFLGVVSHELRTPLNAIMGWTRLAGMSREAGIDSRLALDAVDRNARALARLVDDLLDVPRIMMGKLALDLQPVDLVKVVQTSADEIRPAADAKSLTVRVSSRVATAPLEADPHRLQQIFGNLLSNAVKFTPPGGEIALEITGGAERFVVTVQDSGAGIAADFLPFVFDRFRQADSSTTRAHGGLGIGLSIVRHLVEMHGGQVVASSEGLGRGSTFTVSLPATFVPRMPQATASNGHASAALQRLQNLRVLIVDDEEDSREVLSRILQLGGAFVTSAPSVADAAKVLAAAPEAVDAVLCDIGMPTEDGYTFISSLRASLDGRLRSLPALAVTAYASKEDRARTLAAGFDGHIAKPVSVEALTEALVEALASRAAPS